MEFAGEIVPVKQFVAAAKSQLGIEIDTTHDIYLERVALEGIRHLDTLSLLKKNICSFKICENKIKLPCGFSRLLALRLGSGDNCTDAIYVDLKFLKNCGCAPKPSSIKDWYGTFEIQNGFIWFHSDLGTITDATIAYLSFHTDKDGLLIGQADHERAIIAYCCHKFTLKNFMDYPWHVQEQYRQEWMAQKNWVKGTDWAKSFRDCKNQIREWTNALIVDKALWTNLN